MYKSLTAQSLHYFARPHTSPVRTPLGGPAAWRGSEMAARTDWQVTLEPDQVEELDAAVRVATATGKPLRSLSRASFPLPTLGRDIARWRAETCEGRGFVLIRGVPVERWGREASELFFYGFGLHMGVPGAQNEQGDMLGHVVDRGDPVTERSVRRYRTRADIAYHCDVADAVGLLCLRKAKSGGASRIVSSISVYNELLAQRADLVDRLYDDVEFDTHGQRGLDHFPIAPCRYAEGHLRTFYHADYFRSAQDYEDVQPWSEEERALFDLYDEIAASRELRLDMDLAPGDVQVISNHTILHARTEYEDHLEPDRRRHLLRLWLSLEPSASPRERVLAWTSRAKLVATLARRKLLRRIQGSSKLRRTP